MSAAAAVRIGNCTAAFSQRPPAPTTCGETADDFTVALAALVLQWEDRTGIVFDAEYFASALLAFRHVEQ